MTDTLMYIPNDNTKNYPLCRLQLMVETFGHSTKWTSQLKFNKSKQFRPMNKKRYCKTLGTSVINDKRPNVASFPDEKNVQTATCHRVGALFFKK